MLRCCAELPELPRNKQTVHLFNKIYILYFSPSNGNKYINLQCSLHLPSWETSVEKKLTWSCMWMTTDKYLFTALNETVVISRLLEDECVPLTLYTVCVMNVSARGHWIMQAITVYTVKILPEEKGKYKYWIHNKHFQVCIPDLIWTLPIKIKKFKKKHKHRNIIFYVYLLGKLSNRKAFASTLYLHHKACVEHSSHS